MSNIEINFPVSWQLIPVSDSVINIPTTGIKIPQKQYLPNGLLPVIDQGQDYIGGYTDNISLKINCELPVIVFGDHTRIIKYVNIPFAAGADGLKVLQPQKFFQPKLLSYFAQYLISKLTNYGYARHYQHLSKELIPIPPLAEQHRIVAKIEELFSELDKGIENLKTARAQLKVYRQAVLKHAFEGKVLVRKGIISKPFSEDLTLSLGEVIQSLGQGWSPRCLETPSQCDEAWGVIRTTAIQPLHFDDSKNKQLPIDLVPRPHLEIYPGDVLITRAGPRNRVGIACYVKNTRRKLMVCDKAYRIKVYKEKILPQYLVMLLNTSEALGKLEKLKSGISDSGLNLTQDKFMALKVIVPSLEHQHLIIDDIEEKMTNVTFFEAQIENSLLQSEALRQSILKKAFSGALVGQDANDEPASVLLARIKAEIAAKPANKRLSKDSI